MSNTYLDKYRSSLPTSQGNQILKLLVSKRDSGEIKNLEEFKNQLKELTSKLLTQKISPTLQLYKAIGGVDTNQEIYNYMIDRILDDLDTAFTEADNIDSIIDSHHQLIEHVSLKMLRLGMNELDSKVSLYEFLNRNSAGFDDATYNTFRESQVSSSTRSNSLSNFLFVDPRLNSTAISPEEDCFVDTVGERLTLGTSENRELQIKNVSWLSNSNSIRSELNVEFKNSYLSNIIDGKNNTYWVAPILVKSLLSSGAPMELAFYLGGTEDINYVEIEPATRFPIKLIGINYLDSTGTQKVLSVFDDKYLKGPVRINLPRTNTNCLILKFVQENYSETQFKHKLGQSNFERVMYGEPNNGVDRLSINQELTELLASNFILSDILSASSNTFELFKYYEYDIGFDNIRIGFSTYQERGVFVSSPKKVTQLGQIALRVGETRPVQEPGAAAITLETFGYSETDNFHHGVAEYWAFVEQYSADNYLVVADMVPLLPIDAQKIIHEQLVFTINDGSSLNPNVTKLMFYTDSLKVYRNGLELTQNTEWEIATDYSEDNPGASTPMCTTIKILSLQNPLDIYTASYTPILSNTSKIPLPNGLGTTPILSIVDLKGDQSVRLAPGNIVVFDKIRNAHTIDHSVVYLIIILRRNSAEQNYSPTVEEYMLVTGSTDTQKFIGD